jgi:hypothetical protein
MFFNSRQMQPLSMETLAKRAPAVFANDAHERTSDRYLFIQTQKIVEGLVNNGWSVVSAVQQRSRTQSKEHGKHALMLVRQDMLAKQFDVGDIMPMLKITNSHNGLSAFQLEAALFRKVCANGLTVPDGMLMAPKVRHTVNINKETIEASFQIIKDFPSLMGKIDSLKSVNLSNEERLLLAQSAARLIFDEEQIERTGQAYRDENAVAKQLLESRRYEDRKTDLWTSLNVIQENAIRGNVKILGETGKIKRTKTVSNIDRDSRINREILTLANEFAKLKGAA